MAFILGKKIGMTTIFDEKQGAQNVTLVECGSKVSFLRTVEKDGYQAVQLEMDKTKKKKAKKEFKAEAAELKVGDLVDISAFKIGDKVKVSGIAKAKGFQGVVKRHGFAGSAKTHGHKHDLRAPGSIGSGFPEHVTKGKRMALPSARIMIHQPLGGAQGQATDIELEAKEILRMKKMLTTIIAENSGQKVEKVVEDCERDHFLTAQEALEYGLIDKVVTRDKK